VPSTSGKPKSAEYVLDANMIGSLNIAPQAIYFGAVAHGAQARRTLIVTAKSSADLSEMSVVSPSKS